MSSRTIYDIIADKIGDDMAKYIYLPYMCTFDKALCMSQIVYELPRLGYVHISLQEYPAKFDPQTNILCVDDVDEHGYFSVRYKFPSFVNYWKQRNFRAELKREIFRKHSTNSNNN